MLSHCLSVETITESKKPRIAKINEGKPTLLSKCNLSNSKNLGFIKEQVTIGLLSSLGISMSLINKIQILV